MTDLERMELALRRTLSHITVQPHETGVEGMLHILIEQLQQMAAEEAASLRRG